MYLLNLPEYKIEDFFDQMLEGRHDNIKNLFLKTRLLSIKSELQDSQNNYRNLGDKGLLHTVKEHDNINIPINVVLDNSVPRTISAKEMEKVYSNFLVDKPDSDKIGRKVYDAILSNTYHNLCPYCSHREVKTVDHYLPKSKFPTFAITPENLLPSCSDCNKDKLDEYQLDANNMLVHPYFDNTSRLDWLTCHVVDSTWSITFTYNVSDTIIDSVLKSRIRYQFLLLNLNKLYADNATREFRKRVKSLIREYNSNPANKAIEFINDNIVSYQSENQNSWQSKMFDSLKNSSWFLDNALPLLEKYYVNSNK